MLAKYSSLAIFVVVGATSLRPALAAPWEPKGKPARQLLDQGRAAFKAGQYREAADLFLQSATTEDNHNARWNAGQSLAAAGDWRRAADVFDLLAKDRTLPRKRRADVEQRQRVAAVFVAADYAAEAERWDDATAVLQKLLTDPALGDRDRTSATAALTAVAARHAKADADRARAEDAARDAATKQAPPPDATPTAPASSPASDSPPAAHARPSRLSDTLALSLLGAGVVGVAVGGGLVWNASGLDDDANAETNQGRIIELRDRADTRRTAGEIALGVGGALVIAGAIKFAIPPEAPRPAIAAVQPVGGGAVVIVGGSFW